MSRHNVAKVIVTLGCLAWVTGSASPASAGGAANVVLVQNSTDGNGFSRSGVMVAYNPTDSVTNENLAIANSSDCTGCRTVSVAMQVVIIERDPQEIAPHNAAVASNGNCDSCETYAFAYQYVIKPGTMVNLSGTAQQGIVDVRRDVAAAAQSGDSYEILKPQLDDLCNRLADIVRTDLGVDAPPCVEDSQVAV